MSINKLEVATVDEYEFTPDNALLPSAESDTPHVALTSVYRRYIEHSQERSRILEKYPAVAAYVAHIKQLDPVLGKWL